MNCIGDTNFIPLFYRIGDGVSVPITPRQQTTVQSVPSASNTQSSFGASPLTVLCDDAQPEAAARNLLILKHYLQHK